MFNKQHYFTDTLEVLYFCYTDFSWHVSTSVSFMFPTPLPHNFTQILN